MYGYWGSSPPSPLLLLGLIAKFTFSKLWVWLSGMVFA